MLSRRSLPDSPPPWDSTRSRCQWFCFLVDGDCLAVGVVEVRGPANAEGVSRLLRTSRSSERDARRSALSLQRLPAVAIPMTNYRFQFLVRFRYFLVVLLTPLPLPLPPPHSPCPLHSSPPSPSARSSSRTASRWPPSPVLGEQRSLPLPSWTALTRRWTRANAAHEHVDVGVEYYTQRCHTPGTLIITEGNPPPLSP